METGFVFFAQCFLWGSLAAALWPLWQSFFGGIFSNEKIKVNRKLWTLMKLFLALYLLRFAAGAHELLFPPSGEPSANGGLVLRELFNQLYLSFRALLLEEEYRGLLSELGALLNRLARAGHAAMATDVCKVLFYGLATLLHFAVPILGGAIVLDALAGVFPNLKLWWSLIRYRKEEKIYFSELNEASLTLAKSLAEQSRKNESRMPVIVFTDAYVDDEKEKDYELFLEAKHFGAICIRDDLSHALKPKNGTGRYYLIDEKEFGNLNTLMELTEEYNFPFVKKSRIYLFVQTDAYVRFEKAVREKLAAKNNRSCKEKKSPAQRRELWKKRWEALLSPSFWRRGLNVLFHYRLLRESLRDGLRSRFPRKRPEGDELPLIVPVNAFRNLAQNLLTDVPLYEPLLRRKDRSHLTVTIFGNGSIGTEAFLGIYWFGQMLAGNEEGRGRLCQLTVNVVSKDAPEEFWAKLDYINPEIRKTVKVLGEEEKESSATSLLDCKGEKNPEYCFVRYLQSDIKIGGFWEGDSLSGVELTGTDYFIVGLGNDADNVAVAEKLRLHVGEAQLKGEAQGDVVIAYAVFHSGMCRALNQSMDPDPDPDATRSLGPRICCYAFGALEQVYSCENVLMTKSSVLADGIGNAYRRKQNRSAQEIAHANRSKNEDKNYNHWSDLARAMHVKYKLFSLGWIDCSPYDPLSEGEVGKITRRERYQQRLRQLGREYQQTIVAVSLLKNEEEKGFQLQEADGLRWKDLHKKGDALAWLEHRRWCAFGRTMGYRATDCTEENLVLTKTHKNMPLKLHPCLVEAEYPAEGGYQRIPDSSKDQASHDAFVEGVCRGEIAADPLDRLSCRWEKLVKDYGKKHPEKKKELPTPYDFKTYDFCMHEFEEYTMKSTFDRFNRREDGRRRIPALSEGRLEALLSREGEEIGAIAYLIGGRKEWLIPKGYLLSRIEKLCKKPPMDQAQRHRAQNEGYENCFCYAGEWFLNPGERRLRERKAEPRE